MSHHDLIAQMMDDAVVIKSDGSLLNFLCDSTTGWGLTTSGDDTITQTTESGEEVFLLDSGPINNGWANPTRLGFYSLPTGNIFTATVRMKTNHLGTNAEGDTFEQSILGFSSSRRLVFNVYSDGFRLYADVANTFVFYAMTTPIDDFFELTFVQKIAEKTTDVYLDSELIYSDLDSGHHFGGSVAGLYSQSLHTPNTRMLFNFSEIILGEGLA